MRCTVLHQSLGVFHQPPLSRPELSAHSLIRIATRDCPTKEAASVDGGSGLAPSGRVLSSPTVARSIHIPCSHSSSLHPGLLVCNVCHLDVAWTWLRCGAEITT